MDALVIAKQATSFVVGAVTAKVVHSIIQNNTSSETSAEKAQIAVGSLVLGSMVGDLSGRYTDAKIDWIAGMAREVIKKSESE